MRNRCVRVLSIYVIETRSARLDMHIYAQDCVRINPLVCDGKQMLSLDSESILLELEEGQFGDDHRECCRSWAPNVLRIANHRTQITSQSLAMARDALPCDSSAVTTVLLFGPAFTFDTVYRGAVRATYNPRNLLVFQADTTPFAEGLAKRQGRPRTCLAELFANLLHAANE